MASDDSFDALIVGGGPAGAACAIWLKLLGHAPLIVEKQERLGGLQNQNPYPGDWLPGQPGITGPELAARIHDHVMGLGIAAWTRCALTQVSRNAGGGWTARLAGAGLDTARARFLVLATGVGPASGGFTESATVLIGPGRRIAEYDFRGKRVAILGGGDNAFENFLYARDRGATALRIFARHVRARADYRRQVPESAISTTGYRADARRMTIDGEAFDVFLVLYGWEPVNPVAGQVALATDERGFVRTDGRRRTSDSDVYAIGELTQQLHPCVATAIADGVVCAKDIQERIESRAGSRPG